MNEISAEDRLVTLNWNLIAPTTVIYRLAGTTSERPTARHNGRIISRLSESRRGKLVQFAFARVTHT